MKTKTKSKRCEGWRRNGGAFTLGPVRWEQCKNIATVMLKLKQDGKVQSLPACKTCHKEAVSRGLEIISTAPIKRNSK